MIKKPVKSLSQVTQRPDRLPSIVTLPLATEIACLNFVNTVRWRLLPHGSRDTLTSYSDLLAFALRSNSISVDIHTRLSQLAANAPSAAERTLKDSISFRNSITVIIEYLASDQQQNLSRSSLAQAIAIFDAARRKAHESELITLTEKGLELTPRPEEEGLDLPWLVLVRDAEQLLCSTEAGRIKLCSAEGCGWVFLDESKNKSRRWCSMQICGNREKIIRYKAKIAGS